MVGSVIPMRSLNANFFKKIGLVFFVSVFILGFSEASAASLPLKGFAWTKNFGWVSFSSKNCDRDGNGKVDSGDCGSDNISKSVIDYGVYVNSATGLLSGYAWSNRVGWISFENTHTTFCPDNAIGLSCEPKINLSNGKISGFARAISPASIRIDSNFTGGGGGSGGSQIIPPARVDTPSSEPPPAPYVRITNPTIYSTVTEENSFYIDAVAGVTPGYQGSYRPGVPIDYEWRRGIDERGCESGEILQSSFFGRRASFGSSQSNQLWEGKNVIFVRARAVNNNGEYSDWSRCDFRVVYFLPQIQFFDSPIARREPVSFVINDILYTGLGVTNRYVSTGSYLNDFWKYDVLSGMWTRLGNFSGSLVNGRSVFTIGNKGYVVLGYQVTTGSFEDSFFSKELWEYDPSIDTWTRKADFPGIARGWASVFVINGKAYVGAGMTKDGALTNPYPLRDFYSYSPETDSWSAIAELPGLPRGGATSFSIGGKGYIGLGTIGDGSTLRRTPGITEEVIRNLENDTIPIGAPYGRPASPVGQFYAFDFWEYNPSSDSWQSVGNFPGKVVIAGEEGEGRARERALYVSKNGRGYFTFGGGNGENEIYTNLYKRTMWEFNPQAIFNKWREYSSAYEYKGTFGFVLNDRIYSIFGDDILNREVSPVLIEYNF